MAKISVIMPAYNAAPYIKDAVDSLLQQTYTDLELLIFDDASTDNTAQIIEDYTDSRIRYYCSDRNRGYLYHLNQGLKLANGEYIARMDADDISMANRFQLQLAYLNDNPQIDLVGSNVYTMSKDGRKDSIWAYPESPDRVAARLLFNTSHAHPSIFFRRRIVDNGYFSYDESFYTAEDFELWTRLSVKIGMGNVQEPLLIYRISDSQISQIMKSAQSALSLQIRNAYVSRFREFTDPEEENLFSNFWGNAFRVKLDEFTKIMAVYESIFLKAHGFDFKKEMAEQVKSLVIMYSGYERSIYTWYQDSVFSLWAPLTPIEQLKNWVNRILRR